MSTLFMLPAPHVVAVPLLPHVGVARHQLVGIVCEQHAVAEAALRRGVLRAALPALVHVGARRGGPATGTGPESGRGVGGGVSFIAGRRSPLDVQTKSSGVYGGRDKKLRVVWAETAGTMFCGVLPAMTRGRSELEPSERLVQPFESGAGAFGRSVLGCACAPSVRLQSLKTLASLLCGRRKQTHLQHRMVYDSPMLP